MEFLLALVMGFTLGLLGGGGSILTVPILVYVAGIEPVRATGYSLFIVGITALMGAVSNIRASRVRFKEGVLFAIPAFSVVYTVRSLILPMLPASVEVGGFTLMKATGIMLFFASVMLAAGISMLLPQKNLQQEQSINYFKIIASGFAVGVITSFVGAGGGFLIVPALVILLRLSMPEAIGTSLFIIAVNSLIGFIGELRTAIDIDWSFLGLFSGISMVGMMGGTLLSKNINPVLLRRIFAFFILAMSGFIAIKESLFSK